MVYLFQIKIIHAETGEHIGNSGSLFYLCSFFLQRTVGKELKMERIFWEAVEENPIIAAVKSMEDLGKCCGLAGRHVVCSLF